jgi:hypothetical protein
LLLREMRWRGGIRLQRWHFAFGGLAESERGITLVLWQCRLP